jgi:cytochrome c biogenesis protein CcmG/thiol:disulfide interchange protein DsbE
VIKRFWALDKKQVQLVTKVKCRYYRGMTRFRHFAALLCLLLLAGCDRGAKPGLVGKAAPDFRVQDEDRAVALSDLRGKVVVLNFWASWCPPCIEEAPSLVAMQDKLRGRVTVFAVSTDETREGYQKFLREQKANFLTVRDSAKNSSMLYGTFGYPETYIIDARGVVRRKFIGPVDWTSPDIIQYLTSL